MGSKLEGELSQGFIFFDITTDIVEAIAKLKEEYETETMRVVFKDSSFKNAVEKTNAIQILKQFDIDEVVSV